jgi:hypothetical protein
MKTDKNIMYFAKKDRPRTNVRNTQEQRAFRTGGGACDVAAGPSGDHPGESHKGFRAVDGSQGQRWQRQRDLV